MSDRGHSLAFCGGIGGAKSAFGLTEPAREKGA